MENSPEGRRLVRSPRHDAALFGHRAAGPSAGGVEALAQILQAGRRLKDDASLSGRGVPVFERRHHALRVHARVPFVLGVDDGKNVRRLQLQSEDQGLDVIDIGCLIGWPGFGNSACAVPDKTCLKKKHHPPLIM